MRLFTCYFLHHTEFSSLLQSVRLLKGIIAVFDLLLGDFNRLDNSSDYKTWLVYFVFVWSTIRSQILAQLA